MTNKPWEILNYVPQGIFLIDQDYKVVFWNSCMEDWIKVNTEYIIGKSILTVFPKLGNKSYINRFEGLFQGGPPVILSSQLHRDIFNYEGKRSNIKIYQVIVSSVPCCNSKSFYAMFSLDNVTELTNKIQEAKSLQKILNQKVETLDYQNRFQNFVSDISMSFISSNISNIHDKINTLLSRSAKFLSADRAYIFEISSDGEGLSNSYEWCIEGLEPLKYDMHDLSIKNFPWMIKKIKNEGILLVRNIGTLKENEQKEIHLLKSHGSCSLLIIPFGRGDAIDGIIGFETTETNKGWIDNEVSLIKILVNTLTNAYIKINYEKELIIARDIAEAANKAKSQFLANMSHEIRTPLSAVIGFTELLKDSYLKDSQKVYAENAYTSAQSLLSLVNDILDFSKIEAGMLELDFSMNDIIEVVVQASDIVKYQAFNKGLELLIHISHDIPRFVYSDPLRLRQILVNLLNNAVKFTHKGEVALKVTFNKINDHTGIFSFEIRDTGIGISVDQQGKLFKAFSQADSSTTRQYGGTGLGLIISSLLAEKMDSKIELRSQINKGTTFYFDIKTSYDQGDARDIKSFSGIRKALVIDDNDYNRSIIGDILTNWKIFVTESKSFMSDIKYIESGAPYDLLIIDYNMPYVNGLETLKMIRHDSGLISQETAVILMITTSDDIDFNYKETASLKIDTVIYKPIIADNLYNSLCSIYYDTDPEKVIKQDLTPIREMHSKVQMNNLSVLVVEDVPMNRTLINIIISSISPSISILESNNGEEAVKMVKESNIDLILMDVQMPVMDGIEATKIIKKTEKGENLPIIALTAGATKHEKEKCIKAGMDGFLIKPINSDKLKGIFYKYFKDRNY